MGTVSIMEHQYPNMPATYPLVICYIAIEHGPVEIVLSLVSFLMKNGGCSQLYERCGCFRERVHSEMQMNPS